MTQLVHVNAERAEHELALRERGYVPITSYEAALPRLHWLLPECQMSQVVPDRTHGRVVWSHPGPSGVDPRAIAALALVRVADGLGEPLDEPMTLLEASAWLLTGDVEPWLLRPRHRILVGEPHVACLFERDRETGVCLTHKGYDRELQRIATALGDETFRHCSARETPRTPRSAWTGVSGNPLAADLGTLTRSALAVMLRLAGWHRQGITGQVAWDLARRGVSYPGLLEWLKEGFTVEEVAQWAFHGDVHACRQYRDLGAVPVGALTLPPVPFPALRTRGLPGHAGKHGTSIKTCTRCGSQDTLSPCRTCRKENGPQPVEAHEWSSYELLAVLDQAYEAEDPRGHVPCGDRNCPTAVTASVTSSEGANQ